MRLPVISCPANVGGGRLLRVRFVSLGKLEGPFDGTSVPRLLGRCRAVAEGCSLGYPLGMFRFEKKLLGTEPNVAHATRLSVRFQDVDAAGIVFFARFFDYVHAAYEEFLVDAGHPLPDVLAEKRWAAPLRHAEADYLTPARFGEVLLIELVASHQEASEISLGWRVRVDGGSAKPTAVVQTVHAFVSPNDFQRMRVPEEISRKLESVELSKS